MGQILTTITDWMAHLSLLHSLKTCFPSPPQTLTIALRQLSRENPSVSLIAGSPRQLREGRSPHC